MIVHLPGIFTVADWTFLLVFLFRYVRTIVHFVTGVFLYRPVLGQEKPRFSNNDVAVVMATVAPNTAEFLRCCETILFNGPRNLILSTVGVKLERDIWNTVHHHSFQERFPDTRICVVQRDEANKRRQVALASEQLDANETPITILVDDHVFWGLRFLESVIPAFDDLNVGIVGTNKKVIRDTSGGLWKSFTNFIACLYLARHNFQIRSEPYLDGGIFVVSGRCMGIRTKILQSDTFKQGFINEKYLFGLLGPLNVDEDNYITRFMLRNGWKVRIQYSEHCKMITPLGEPHKFYGQVLR